MLALLKSGQAKNLGEAALLMGYSTSQTMRWWERYRTGEVAALVAEPHYPGVTPRLTAEARADLSAAMQRGRLPRWKRHASICATAGRLRMQA